MRLSPETVGLCATVITVAVWSAFILTALVPGLSALGAVDFLNEPPHWNLLVGLALVTAGILFGVRAGAMRRAPSARPCPT